MPHKFPMLLLLFFWKSKEVDGLMYHIGISLDRDLFHNWIAEAETKVVCRAKNKNDLLKAVAMEAEEIDKIGKKYQLYN